MRYGPAWELQRRYHSCGRWRRPRPAAIARRRLSDRPCAMKERVLTAFSCPWDAPRSDAKLMLNAPRIFAYLRMPTQRFDAQPSYVRHTQRPDANAGSSPVRYPRHSHSLCFREIKAKMLDQQESQRRAVG